MVDSSFVIKGVDDPLVGSLSVSVVASSVPSCFFCSSMDTSPLSLKEAQLMEKPVIATDVGGNSEIMVDGQTGFLVKEGNSDDIIQKISSFENDNSLAANMGKNGREFIQKEYSLNASAENFLRIIKPYIQKN